jgi:hypothetical protein
MGKIVLDHYPASKLPEELRGNLSSDSVVRITIEEERRAPLSPADFVRVVQERKKTSKTVTIDEAVARVRSLRDEWDD